NFNVLNDDRTGADVGPFTYFNATTQCSVRGNMNKVSEKTFMTYGGAGINYYMPPNLYLRIHYNSSHDNRPFADLCTWARYHRRVGRPRKRMKVRKPRYQFFAGSIISHGNQKRQPGCILLIWFYDLIT